MKVYNILWGVIDKNELNLSYITNRKTNYKTYIITAEID